nr:hypothetical protein [Paenibacillus polymyxa]
MPKNNADKIGTHVSQPGSLLVGMVVGKTVKNNVYSFLMIGRPHLAHSFRFPFISF